MNKSKSTAVREMEAGIQSIFDAKQKASVRDAFDRFIPFGAKSPQLRKSLSELEESGFPGDERATRSIVELSNAIQPFLYHLNDEQYQELNEKFAKTLNHIVRLESSIVKPPPVPKVEPAPSPPPPPLELEVILSNNDVLRKHIETIENQISFVKESKRKLMESNQTHVSQLEKQNAQLRIQLQNTKNECEQYHQQFIQKEKELQMTLVQLSGAQEELKRVKFEYSEKSLNRNAAMESFQRNSKYSAKEFVKLNATIDAMRLELTKERLDRAHERETLKSTLTSAENKLNYSEVMINELRDQLQNIGISQYQETAEFKNSTLNHSISFQPHNLDIEYLHASTGTTAQLNISQSSTGNSRPQFQHPYTPSVLRHGLSKNPLVQSPVHTLPRGAHYAVVENNSPLKSYRYKSPFVVKNVDHAAIVGTPPVYAGSQSVRKRSQSAHTLRQVAYAPIATFPTGRGGAGGNRDSIHNRSSSVGRSGIRSLRGVSKEALKSLSTEEPVSTQALPHHLVETSTSISPDQLLSSGESIADKIGLAAWNHPMYRSLQARGFTSIAAPTVEDVDSVPHTEDGHLNGGISRILATTEDQHSVDESESNSALERVEYITDDMLANEQFLSHHPEEVEEEVNQKEVIPAVRPPTEHEDLKRMPLTPQRLSHSNSFSCSGGKGSTSPKQHSPLSADKRAASLSQIHSASASPLDLSKYRNAASSPIKTVGDVARDQASSPIPHHTTEKPSRHISTSPIPSTEYSSELSRMTPTPQKRLAHTQSFSHAATSTSPHSASHSPLTLDKRSSSLSRVTATQYDPTILHHASTSPIPVVQMHEQGTVTSPIQQYAEDLRNMSESPGKVSRSISFRDQQSSSADLKAPLSSDKRSSSMNHKPSQAFDLSHYKQAPAPVTIESPVEKTHDYSDALKNMSESPSGLSRSQSFNAKSQSVQLKQDKRSSSLSKMNGITRVDSSIRNASSSKVVKPSTPSGLSATMSYATFSIQEVEEEGESSEEENGRHDNGDNDGDGDDLSTITPVIAGDDSVPTPNLMGSAPQAAAHATSRHHDEQLLKSLYEEIQHLKLTHLSPPRVASNRSLPKASPFSGSHHDVSDSNNHQDDLNLTSIHVENLHAIQASLHEPAHHHIDSHTAKYDGLIREYNELLSLYVHEMKKTRRMQIDFRNEIHDSTRSVSEFEELMSVLKSENHHLQRQVDELQSIVVQNVSQHNQHIADVEHKCADMEKELLNAEEILRNKEREVRTLQLTSHAAATAPQNRSSLTNHVESCLVQLKIHSHDREVEKVVELLRKELNALYGTEIPAHSPLPPGGSMRQTASFRNAKNNESVNDLQVDVTMEALKNLLHWFDHTLTSNTAEINSKVRINNELRDRVETQESIIADQNKLLDSKEQLLLDCRYRITELERQRHAPAVPPAVLSAAENQINSLKHQLEHINNELEEAKRRHNNGTANLTITSSGLQPRGSQSPLSRGSGGGSSRNLHQEQDILASAYSGRHSPTRVRQTSRSGRDSGRSSTGGNGFVSPDEEDRYHDDLQYIAQPSTNSSRFRESLINNTSTAGAGVEPFSPNVDPTHVRRSLDSNVNQSQHTHGSTSVVVKELEKRALAAEMKCELLSNQIKNMPASLSVANAEKRVMECKLKKATLNFEVTIKQMEADALHKIGEFKTFLQLERTEKEAMQTKIKDQAATIHQLTHHLKIIHASKAPPEVSVNSASFLYNEGTIRVQVPPAPWENGVEDAGSVAPVTPSGLNLSVTQQLMQQSQLHQHSLRSSNMQQSSRPRDSHFYNSVEYGSPQRSRGGVSPQRGRRN